MNIARVHPFFDLEVKARHYLRQNLKLLVASKKDMLIRKIENKFVEFSVDYNRHSEAYDFMNPNKVILEFIENVVRLCILEANGEFRLVFCIIRQSVVELYGRRLYINSCFTTRIVEGDMNSRVKNIYLIIPRKEF